MLSRPSTNQPLKSFHLNFFYGHPDTVFNVTKWLKAAKQHCVEELHLSLRFHTLNPVIFISQTLVVLKLKRIDFSIDTSCVHLPLLKKLHLKYVGFRNRNDYINFLSASPILHKLHAEHIRLRSEMRSDKNNIPEEGFKSLTLSKLVRASISSMDALFNGIDNVEFLRITKGFKDQEATFIAIPLFPNLNHIELVFCNSSFHCWDGIGELLRHCPKLQILIIKKWTTASSSNEWKHPLSVHECVSSHLRSCTILNFHGSANDLRFATYILQNAGLLEDMKIGVTTNRMHLGKSQIKEELSSCPTISSRCKLSFKFKYCY
ncbi:putative FBD domain, leucine-rich repeat domain, L domain-containing protein [Medicago truncatula]|uniref:FBD protein n=1 Tax=Medicago truncatula TaxID=3880 RepID=A0A072U7T4_MEDTR|nr:FBD protein [Medicago truncatula]RHN50546.1 putative FBD domain, leucine-rich repeat domain, L domain-containing protein [Medicago truncatula]